MAPFLKDRHKILRWPTFQVRIFEIYINFNSGLSRSKYTFYKNWLMLAVQHCTHPNGPYACLGIL